MMGTNVHRALYDAGVAEVLVHTGQHYDAAMSRGLPHWALAAGIASQHIASIRAYLIWAIMYLTATLIPRRTPNYL